MSPVKEILLRMPGFQALCRRLTRGHVRVFMYHRFRADSGAGEGLRASVFRQQLRLIKNNHPVWTAEQQLGALAGHPIAGACPVVITADDGYRDYYEIAYPILREYGVPALLFVTTGFVEGAIWFWWDKLRYLGQTAPPAAVTIAIAGQSVRLDFTSPAGRREAVRFLINRSRFISDDEKQAVLARLSAALQVALPAQPPPEMAAVSWDQVRAMHAHGLLFAPHTVTHPILTRISPEQAAEEVRSSRDRLAEILGDAGRMFAYPQGGPSDFDATVSRIVAEAGFEGCYLAYQGPRLDDDPLQLPRYCPGESMTAFNWSLCGAEHLSNRLRRFLRLRIDPGEQYWYGSQPSL